MSNIVPAAQAGAMQLTEAELLEVLQASLYPGASVASCKLVLGYCKAAGLDPMQKPVHIVPMRVKKPGTSDQYEFRDVVMPGINLYRTQAARSGNYAGVSEPAFGDTVQTKLGGADVTYPAWCRVTVSRRMPSGEVAEFSAVEFWVENYATASNATAKPNAMWMRRPFGQLAKCAEAQALRKAFPEIAGQPTADEMEGKTMGGDAVSQPVADVKEAPSELLAAAREAADRGRRAYGMWYHALTVPQRISLAYEHDAMIERARAADQRASDAQDVQSRPSDQIPPDHPPADQSPPVDMSAHEEWIRQAEGGEK